jgi:hypothetical protein
MDASSYRADLIGTFDRLNQAASCCVNSKMPGKRFAANENADDAPPTHRAEARSRPVAVRLESKEET